MLLLWFFKKSWIKALCPLLLTDRCDLFFSSSCYSKHQPASRQPERSPDGPAKRKQPLIPQTGTSVAVSGHNDRCIMSEGARIPLWGHHQHRQTLHLLQAQQFASKPPSTALLLHPQFVYAIQVWTSSPLRGNAGKGGRLPQASNPHQSLLSPVLPLQSK